MKVFETLDLTSPDVVLGRHSAWLPKVQIKVPFQHGGMITKYTCPGQGITDPEATIPHEVAIFKALAKMKMAPSIGEFVYFKEVISLYDGAWRCDPLGAYGFKMRDATKLAPGCFDIKKMRELPIKSSEGAWGDVLKNGNTINGYLIDVRRSAWDMMKWKGEKLPTLVRYEENVAVLEGRIKRDCQFPKNERVEPYQDIWLGTHLVKGARNVEKRAAQLGFSPGSWESVLDIGCQTGGMLQHSWFKLPNGEEGIHAGVDIDQDYVMCARAAARINNQNLCIRRMNVGKEVEKLLKWTQKFFKGPPVHLLLLSMEKHLGESVLWQIVDEVHAEHVYIETNAMKEGAYRLLDGVDRRGGKYLGDSDDRNTRRLYRI